MGYAIGQAVWVRDTAFGWVAGDVASVRFPSDGPAVYTVATAYGDVDVTADDLDS